MFTVCHRLLNTTNQKEFCVNLYLPYYSGLSIIELSINPKILKNYLSHQTRVSKLSGP
jgi:hypothetical protein